MSAALRTWSQSSSQKAKWCSAPFGPLTIAMSCGEWLRSSHTPSWWPLASRTCSVIRKPRTLLEERGGLADLLGVDQHVVEPRRRDAGHAGRRDRRRVELAQQAAGLVQLVDQLHGLPGRDVEPDRLALADGLAAADPLDLAAVLRYGVLQLGQVVLALDPEAEQVEPGPRVVAEPDRVVVLLVPALEVDRVVAALGQLQAQYLGVVGGGQLKVGGTDVDVGKAQDSHGASRGLGKCLTRRTYLA